MAGAECGIVSQVRADQGSHGGWDFFVSYTQSDQAWAEWIAWVIEEEGLKVLIQAWDFVPGSNWIQDMQRGTRDATRTIAVLSDAYLESVYGSAEWQTAWASDLDGTHRKLLVIRVTPCERPGLLAGVVGVDLFGVTEAVARTRLRSMVKSALMGRAKPSVAPRFPGLARAVPHEPQFPGPETRVTSPRSSPRVGKLADQSTMSGQPASVIEVAISPDKEPGSYLVEVVSSSLGDASAAVNLDAERLLARRDELESVILASAISTGRTDSQAERRLREVYVRLERNCSPHC
jgi:hypothetical protein